MHMTLAGELKAHLAGCLEQNKHVNATLTRLEIGQQQNNSSFTKFIMLLLGAEAAVLLAIFAAWLASGGWHHL